MGIFINLDRNGLHYWHIKAANGEILAHSEGYTTRQGAERGAQAAIEVILKKYKD